MSLHELTAIEIAQALDSGEATAEEILNALLARADEMDGKIKAIALRFPEAMDAARASDERRAAGLTRGPLDGVPVTIKENVDADGHPTTLGVVARRDHIASRDAVIVQLLKEAGAVIIGKTNVPQTLLSPMETTNEIYGSTLNPWRTTHGPGGSSGGEAAALALGVSALGVGTDIGGSIRVPAAFCGVAGLKPTIDRWSNLGVQGSLAGQELIRAQTGPLARTASDVRFFFEALPSALHNKLDPRIPVLTPNESLDISELTIGYYEDDGFFSPAASIKRAIRTAVEALRDAGATVVPFAPPNVEEIVFLYFQAMSGDGLATLEKLLDGDPFIAPLRTMARIARMPAGARRGVARALELVKETRLAALLGALGDTTVARHWEIAARRDQLRVDEMRTWNEAGVDAVIAPNFVTTAAPLGMAHDFTLGFVNVARYSFLNLPAGSVPITKVKSGETARTDAIDRLDNRARQIEAESLGLPVGVQVISRPWREDIVLRCMCAIEAQLRDRGDFPKVPVDPR